MSPRSVLPAVGFALAGCLAAVGNPPPGTVPRQSVDSAAAVGFAAATAPSVGFTFKAFGYGMHDLARQSYPYARQSPVARVDTGTHDAAGVRMVRINGRLYDHPVAQATYGLANLESFRITRDDFYLRRAVAQADRLMARARKSGGAWYLPYVHAFTLHRLPSERMRPPWYSAMAQGQALSLFVRLTEVTGQARFRTAANAVFATYLRPRGKASPWTVWVDGSGYLWLEEYAGPRPDRTYNGHMFAAWGLWDYWRLTADARAVRLWDGALTTAVIYAPVIRNAGGMSSYCLSHQWSKIDRYHFIHTSQLTYMYAISHHPALARYAEAFDADYPRPGVRGTVRFAAGTHQAYRFDAAGRVLRRTAVTFSRAVSAPGDGRRRVPSRQGYWYRITKGALAGYEVQEHPGKVALAGSYLTFSWAPARPASLAGGRTVVGYVFSSAGTVTRSQRFTPSTRVAFGVSQTAHWNAVRYALAADGPLAGYWLPMSAVTFA